MAEEFLDQFALDDEDITAADAEALRALGPPSNGGGEDEPDVISAHSANNLAGHVSVGSFLEGDIAEDVGDVYEYSMGAVTHDPEGPSSLLNSVTAEAKAELILDTEEVIQGGLSPEATTATVKALQQVLNAPMSEVTATAVRAYKADTGFKTVEDADQQDLVAETVGQIHDMYTQLQAIENTVAAEGSLELASNLTDVATYVVPLWELWAANQNVAGLEIEEGTWLEKLQSIGLGEQNQKVRNFLMWLPPSERVTMTKKVLAVVKENVGQTMMGNDLQMLQNLRMFLRADGYSDTERWIDNIVGVLDFALVGWLYKIPARLANAAKTKQRTRHVQGAPDPVSVQSITNVINPQVGNTIQAASLRDTSGQLVRITAGVDDQIVHTTLPKQASTGPLQGAPTKVQLDSSIRTSQQENLLDYVDSNRALTFLPQEVANAKATFIEQLKNINGISVRPANSSFVQAQDGFRANVVYGRTDTNGFSTIKKAREQVERSLGHLDIDWDNLRYFNKDKATGEYHEVAKPGPRQHTFGNYLVQVPTTSRLSPVTVNAFEEGATGISFLDKLGIGGNRWWRDAPAIYNKNILMAANRAVDLAFYTQAELGKILSPFTTLSKKGQGRVVKVLEKGAQDERRYSYRELRMQPWQLTDEEINGVFSQYKYWDTHWAMENFDLVQSLRKDGAWVLEHGTGANQTKMLANPRARDKITDAEVTVFDPVQDATYKMPASDIDLVYNTGGQLGELRHKWADDFTQTLQNGNTKTTKEQVDYILHAPASNTHFRAVSSHDQILSYRPGYYRRYYDNAYFLKTRTKLSSGKYTAYKTIAATNEKVLADRAVEQMRLNNPTEEFIVHRDRALGGFDGSQSGNDLENFLVNTRRTVHRRRGDHLSGIGDAGNLEGMARTLDPLESIGRSMQEVATQVSGREFFENMQARFVKTYGPLFTTKGVYPRNVTDFVRDPPAGFTKADITKAKEMHAWLTQMKGGLTELQDAWKNRFLSVGEVIAGKDPGAARRALAETFVDITKDVDPAMLAKNIAFKVYLSSNPTRQILVQSSQLMQLFAIKPLYVGGQGMSSDMAGVIAKNTGNKFVGDPSLGRRYNELAEGFEKSGLGLGIDHNLLRESILTEMRRTAPDSGWLSKLSQNIIGAADAPFKKGTQVGFDVGEYANVLGSWLVARKRWVDNNPGKDWKKARASAEIASDARALSLNMNRAGKFRYNDGYAAMVMQFMAVPNKMLLAMAPKALGGSRAFTSTEKMRLWATNVGLYGGSTFGLGNYLRELNVTEGWNMTAETMDTIADGFLNLYLNKGYSMMFGEDDLDGRETRLRFTEHMAPAGGTWFFTDKLDKLMGGDLQSLWALAGAGPDFLFNEKGRFLGFIQGLNFLDTMRPDHKSFWEPDEAPKVFRKFAQMFSGPRGLYQYSDYLKQRFVERTGKLVSASGVGPDVLQSRAEAIAQLFTGVRTAAEADFYLNRKISYDRFKNLDEDAQTMVKQLIQYQQDIGMDGDIRGLQSLLEGLATIDLALDESDKHLFMKQFIKHAKAVHGKRNPLQWFLRRWQADGMNVDPKLIKSRIDNDAAIPDTAKEELYKWIQDIVNARQEDTQ